jgi:sugar phosphate isomerase/epimerase
VKLAYSTNAYRRCSLDEALERVAALGYRGIELMADVPHAWPATAGPDRLTAIRGQLANRTLEIANINAFMMNAVQDFWHPSWIEPDEAYRSQRVEHTIAALRMAAALGAPSISTEPGGPLEPGLSRDWAMDTFVEGLTEALPVAEEVGVQLLVEPEPGLLVEDAAGFLELAQRISSPALGLNFDIGHFYCVSEPLPETIRRLEHLTGHYHIEDIAASRVHEHLIPGQGAIDFAAVLQAVAATGYDGWITVELYPYLDDPDAAGAQAKRCLEPLLSPT